jgi:hypothetical protein
LTAPEGKIINADDIEIAIADQRYGGEPPAAAYHCSPASSGDGRTQKQACLRAPTVSVRSGHSASRSFTAPQWRLPFHIAIRDKLLEERNNGPSLLRPDTIRLSEKRIG